ncbi:hypothetical protein BC826DRAFT_1101832 [Russula brevipes]|nr:hypothetical protein BC826DRAFT_1101832 [Russula brevipes]
MGRKSRKPPRFAKKSQRIVALIETSAPICLERFSDYPKLGRSTLYDEGSQVLDRDVFERVKMAERARAHGWAPSKGMCAGCQMLLMPLTKQPGAGAGTGCVGGSKARGKGTARGAVEAVEGDGDEENLRSHSTADGRSERSILSCSTRRLGGHLIINWTESVGVTLTFRDRTRMELRTSSNSTLAYDVLEIFPFMSESERMGIVVRDTASGELTFLQKGADVVMAQIVQRND